MTSRFRVLRRVRLARPHRSLQIRMDRNFGFNLCVSPLPDLDSLPPAQLKELVVRLLNEVAELKQTVAQQREEIARLKGLKGRPEIKPSGMEQATPPAGPKLPGNQPRRGKSLPLRRRGSGPASASRIGCWKPQCLLDRASRATIPIWCRNSYCRCMRSATAASAG